MEGHGECVRACVPEFVECVDALQAAVGLELRDLVAGLGDVGNAQRTGAAEHHNVEERVRTEAVGAVYRRAGSLTWWNE
jgi:hypothetical protein